MWLYFIIWCASLKYTYGMAEPLEIFAWNEMEFNWPQAEDRVEAIKNGSFVPANNIPCSIEIWRDKLFITIPRWKVGVASTLNWVSLKDPIDKLSFLTPYPNWKSNYIQENSTLENTLISASYVRADECDRLWIIDAGIEDITGNLTRLSSPKLMIFDLYTNKILQTHIFDATITKESVLMENIVVDVLPNNCKRAFAYIPDVDGEGLIVYSLEEDIAWRIEHNFFHFDPLKGDMTVGNIHFQWPYGIFGITLSNKKKDGYRTAYFHPLSSTQEFEVSTAILTNQTAAKDSHNFFEFKNIGNKGADTQSSYMEFDKTSEIIYLTQLQKDGIACWNTKKPLSPESVSIIAEDRETMEFPNDIKIDEEEGILYVISNRMSQFLYSKLDYTTVNFRIFKIKIVDAIKDTPCEMVSH